MNFFKGNKNSLDEVEVTHQGIGEISSKLKKIQQDIAKIFVSSNLSFLLGAGCSVGPEGSDPAVPSMKSLATNFCKDPKNAALMKRYVTCGGKADENLEEGCNDLEEMLGVLYSLEYAYTVVKSEKREKISKDILRIKKHIFDGINLNFAECNEVTISVLETYKTFYKKLMYRENSLSKVNIFTTNYDLLNEVAMDDLGIVYCNGFSGNINRYFNPMTFNYAYAEQIGLSNRKYNVIDNYVYLYKLHGSLNWIQDSGDNHLFNIKELQKPESSKNHIMIYPTPTKQSSSFTSPYSDLFREFQKKLMLQDSILVVIGYSFSDEHINNIIFQSLATIPKFRLIIFSYGEMNEEVKKLKGLDDPRIWIINGKDENGVDIADFDYITTNHLIKLDKADDEMEKILMKYIKKASEKHDSD